MKYKVTTELNTSFWTKVFRFFNLRKKRDEFEILSSYEGYKKNDILDVGNGLEIKVVKVS